MSGDSRIALVTGATGGAGRFVAEALARHGWTVRGLHRDPQRARAMLPELAIEWIEGDALAAAQVAPAAEGARIIFHGVNPPGYAKWRELGVPMLANAIAAARVSGARLIFPGNIYNYGPDAGATIREGSPQNPSTRKGRVRVDMEEMLRSAAREGTRSVVVRAGDFLADVPGSWFRAVMVKPGRPVAKIVYPGKPEIGHAWAYLPDLAETVARLAEVEADLPNFDSFNFGGHWTEPGTNLAHAVRGATGIADLPIRPFPWAMVYLGAPFSTFLRELIEMRYLWERPIRLDNPKLVSLLGEEPHTPLDQAVAATLRSMNSLPAGAKPPFLTGMAA